MRTIIKNGKVITPLRIIEEGVIVIEDGIIDKVVSDDNLHINADDRIVDVDGQYVAPGFIDIHTHGGGGHDFMDGSVEAISNACQAHLQYGTTTIVPTTMTSTMEDLFNLLDNFKQVKNREGGSDILGLHLEGPYFSHEEKGAQDPRYIKNPEREEYEKILDYSDDIIRWTVAPELKGALEMGTDLKQRNIKLSIGHTSAVYEEVMAAFENGYDHITHLYSGMPQVRRINAYRYAGVVESAFLIDEMTVEIIADAIHLPESLLKLIYKIKGSDKICLITDSMRAAGMPEGKYILGSLDDGQQVIVEEGVAKLPDRTAFAGSVATADRLVRTMVNVADVPLLEAVKMMTLTPARVMGVADRKGSIAAGKDADIVVFDEDINIVKVMVGGEFQG